MADYHKVPSALTDLSHPKLRSLIIFSHHLNLLLPTLAINPQPSMASTTTTNTTPIPAPTRPLTWFITGTSSGFGYRIAHLAVLRGDNVIATARSLPKLQKLIDDITASSTTTNDPNVKDRLKVLRLDLGDSEEVMKEVVQEAIKFTGRIDVLVNNAGTRLLFSPSCFSNDERSFCSVFIGWGWPGLIGETGSVPPH
jgi:hypothetical protein